MNSIRIELKWATIFFGVSLLWLFFEKSMGWHDELIEQHATYTNFIAPVAVAIYFFALLDKRKQIGGKITWKQAFVSGAIISMIVALLSPLTQYITHEFITPSFLENARNFAIESKMLSTEDANAYFSFKNYVIQSFIGALLMGLVTSSVVAFFVKKS